MGMRGLRSVPGVILEDLVRAWLYRRIGGRIVADLNARWPFGDGEVGVFRAHDTLEHLRDLIHTTKDLHHCLALQPPSPTSAARS